MSDFASAVCATVGTAEALNKKTAEVRAEAQRQQYDSARLTGGQEAQGFALAMRVLALQVSVASDLARCVRDAFKLTPMALTAAQKALSDAFKGQKISVRGTLEPDEKEAGKVVRTANVYASQFNTICKAIATGWTLEAAFYMMPGVTAWHCPAPGWEEKVGFTTWVTLARRYLEANGAKDNRGRPSDPWLIKFAKWCAAQDGKNMPDDDELIDDDKYAFDLLLTEAREMLQQQEAEKAAKKAGKH